MHLVGNDMVDAPGQIQIAWGTATTAPDRIEFATQIGIAELQSTDLQLDLLVARLDAPIQIGRQSLHGQQPLLEQPRPVQHAIRHAKLCLTAMLGGIELQRHTRHARMTQAMLSSAR